MSTVTATCPHCAKPIVLALPARSIPSFRGKFGLTRRQAQIADLAAQGLQIKRIAGIAEMTPQTVRQRLHEIYRRIGIGSRAELMALAYRGKKPVSAQL